MVRRALCVLVMAMVVLAATAGVASALTPKERLGKQLFFDKNLSLNKNQACAACHAQTWGWTGPDSRINAAGAVYEGSIPGAFGNRKPPSAAYAGNSPLLHYDAVAGWVGGMFWDGRATGAILGDPLAEQAKGPFLNPKEQAVPDALTLVKKVHSSSYADLFEQVWGRIDTSTAAGVQRAYDSIGRSIAAYERSHEVSAYTSKYDAWIAKKATLTTKEERGRKLFFGKAMCSQCHVADGAGGAPDDFTSFTYDNLGMPSNLLNPAVLADPMYVDPGLGGYLKSAGQLASVYQPAWGTFKVPTLRNVALAPSSHAIKAYGHNGYFKSLHEIVHFYNTRDVVGAGWRGFAWPKPEYAATVNTTQVGNLGLTAGDEEALVVFLQTLNDGYYQR